MGWGSRQVHVTFPGSAAGVEAPSPAEAATYPSGTVTEYSCHRLVGRIVDAGPERPGVERLGERGDGRAARRGGPERERASRERRASPADDERRPFLGAEGRVERNPEDVAGGGERRDGRPVPFDGTHHHRVVEVQPNLREAVPKRGEPDRGPPLEGDDGRVEVEGEVVGEDVVASFEPLGGKRPATGGGAGEDRLEDPRPLEAALLMLGPAE